MQQNSEERFLMQNSVSRALYRNFILLLLFAGLVFVGVLICLINFLMGNTPSEIIIVIILQMVFLAILIMVSVVTFRKTLLPLHKGEQMIIESFEEVVGYNNPVASANRIVFNEIVETVITRQRESWNRELTANLLRQEARLAELQSQINPHFLYNTLESIRGFALMKDETEIAKMIESLAILFRNNTRKIGMLVSFYDELESIENYIFIQKFRFQNKFTFQMDIEPDADIMKCKVPNFLLQPIIENAIYHGLETISKKGEIILKAYHTQSRLMIQINDNGCGIPDKKLKELNRVLNSNIDLTHIESKKDIHTGIGLVNINQRIKLQYGELYGISVASTEKIGTQVDITLPYTE